MKFYNNRIVSVLLAAFIMAFTVRAQTTVSFSVAEGSLKASPLRTSIENNAGKLLTMLTRACARNSETLNFAGINISPEARTALLQLWKYQHFKVAGTPDANGVIKIEKPVLHMTRATYQIRNILMDMEPVEGKNVVGNASESTEVAIVFDGRGNILDFLITLPDQQVSKVMENVKSVEDEYNRRLVLYWMEVMRTAYVQKDIDLLRELFSPDAVVIVGRVMKPIKSDVSFRVPTSQYTQQSGEEYLNHLQPIFDKYDIELTFDINPDDILSAGKRSEQPRYYIVKAFQDWRTVRANGRTQYHDEGNLFVLWDFEDPERPKLLYRIWQNAEDPKQWDFIDFNNLDIN